MGGPWRKSASRELAVNARSQEVVIGEDEGAYCGLCDMWTNGQEQYVDHLEGQKHTRKDRERRYKARWEQRYMKTRQGHHFVTIIS